MLFLAGVQRGFATIRYSQCKCESQKEQGPGQQIPTANAQKVFGGTYIEFSDPKTEPDKNDTQNHEEERMCREIFGPLLTNWPLVAVGLAGVWAAIRTLEAITFQAVKTAEATEAMW